MNKQGELPRRAYGRESVPLSVIGFGGIVVMDAEQEHANRVVAEAVERGVNYFDVAPSYGDAELKLGPALKPYRKDCFLACKTTERSAEAAKQEFERSLQRLYTDHFDLYQLHAITDVEKDVDAAFAEDGVMPWLIEQKKAGRVRHLGFSAHSVAAALTALDRYEFDSVLLPVNFAAILKGDFGPQVIEKAISQGASVLALKAMARQRWQSKDDRQRSEYPKCWYQPLSERREAEMGLRFTLNLPVTAALPPGDESLWRLALEIATGNLSPLSEDEREQLVVLSRELEPIFVKA
ncbi:MAG: aldo/keto reductase [Phycisphaeraceae bacterium]|nr:aldo/keto reductase [Phycisphaeraceae bacterium]